MRNILFIAGFMITALLSCTKEAKYEVAEDPEFTPVKNSYRAKTISGKNDHWGEFKFVLTYKNEKLDTAQLFNATGRQTGRINVKLSSSTLQNYYIIDFVPKIDPDSIQRLDKRLSEKYGAGNYVLEDSIPLSSETYFLGQLQQDKYTRESKLIRTYYGPVDNPGTGEEYIYKYRKIQQITGKYEYDETNNLIAERVFQDVYDADNENKYKRQITKYEYYYNDRQLTSIIYYDAAGGENFTESDRYNFSYNGNKVTAIQGQHLTKQFSYTGEYISKVSCSGRNDYTYEYDSNGNVTSISYGNGNYMKIEYEKGNGNISQFLSIFDRMMGDPHIR